MPTTPPPHGQFDWAIRFVVDQVLIISFIFVLLPALWKLAMSRPGLIIVFSRAVGNFLRIFGDMPEFVVNNIFALPMTDDQKLVYGYFNKGYINAMSIIPHLHNLALAINRLHGVLLPLHYSMVYAKKKNIYTLCICLWLISICVGVSDNYFYNTYKFYPGKLLTEYSKYASAFAYAILACRMLWIKYKKSSLTGSPTEKDSNKILIVCFACLGMSSLNQLIFNPIDTYAHNNLSESAQLAAIWANYVSQWLILCTEEICLALLVRDFRKLLQQQMRSLLICKQKSSNALGNKNETTNMTKPIRVVNVNTLVKVN